MPKRKHNGNDNDFSKKYFKENASLDKDLSEVLKALKKSGFNERHQPLYDAVTKAVIDEPYSAKRLIDVFKVLNEAGFNHQCQTPYETITKVVINEPYLTESLIDDLKALKEAGFNQQHQPLYEAVIEKPYYGKALIRAFKALKEAGFNQQYRVLYEAVIKKPLYSEKLIDVFKALKEVGFNHQHQAFYLVAVNSSSFGQTLLVFGFKILKEAGFNLEQHRVLYEAVIDNHYNAKKLIYAFKTLNEAGFNYQHQVLYKAVIDNRYNAMKLIHAFKTLNEAGFNYQHQALYEAVIKNSYYAEELSDAFKVLKEVGFSFEQHYTFYQVIINTPNSAEVLANALKVLKEAGFNHQDHDFLFYHLFSKITEAQFNRVLIFRTIERLVRYAKSNLILMPEQAGSASQSEVLRSLLNMEIMFAEGPLNKSAATQEIEKVLELLSCHSLSDIDLYFDESWENYLLKIQNQPIINLSILIKNANLSQIELSEERINVLDKLIQEAYLSWIDVADHLVNRDSIKNLPVPSQKAIKLYTSEKYKNIGCLFRGEKLDEVETRRFTKENINKQGDKDPLICFLLGCLLNDAVSKLGCLAMPFKNESIILDRGEFLTKEEVQGRLSNAWHLPSITSFSANKNGSDYFHQNGTQRTKLENPPSVLPIVNLREREVLFAQGEQMITVQKEPGYFISRIIRSPSLERPNAVWSDLALQEALANYLTKEYKEEKSAIVINGKTIYRPNHNLPHVFRVVNAIELVLSYFSEHAKDEAFKAFCEDRTAEEIEWLKVAAVFSITGRESEISAGENLARYDEYRVASAGHFAEFIKKSKYAVEPATREMAERMFDIVRYMGNPEYEQRKDGSVGINNHDNDNERQCRNFYHRILTIAHKLDLPRCYGASQYQQSMQLCLDLSVQNTSQASDYIEMNRYNIELIKAHGSHLSCDLDPNGMFMDVHCPYQAIYTRSSSTLKCVNEISRTVTKPPMRPEMRRRA